MYGYVGDKTSDEERDVFMEALDELPRLYYGRGSGAGDTEVLACIDTLHRLAHGTAKRNGEMSAVVGSLAMLTEAGKRKLGPMFADPHDQSVQIGKFLLGLVHQAGGEVKIPWVTLLDAGSAEKNLVTVEYMSEEGVYRLFCCSRDEALAIHRRFAEDLGEAQEGQRNGEPEQVPAPIQQDMED